MEEGEEEQELEENDETNSKFDSDSDIEHAEDHIAAVEPKLNTEIPDSADGMMEEDGFDQKSAEVAGSSAADVLESNEFFAKEEIEKEPMDFETCIVVNEISKYDQNERKISKVVDIPSRENNGGSTGTLVVDQHVMDFEAEIAASQISKLKPSNGRIDYNTQISVEDQRILSEMKVASIMVPETSETRTGDGEQPHVDTESDETEVCQLSSAAGSVLIEDVATDKTEPHERKVLKSNITASSVECEAASSDVITCNRNVQNRTSRADSVECENAASEETEVCEIRVCRSSSKFIPVQHEDVQSIDTENYNEKVHKPTSTATSDQKENIPSDETETGESRVLKPSCRAGSVQREDVPSAETEVCERTVHKPTRRARSVQPEDVPSDETEICERKVHKPTRRASSLQPEDILSDEAEIHGIKVCKPTRRASSLQPEDIPSDETEICERKIHKPTRRASSVQREDVLSDETEICERKVCKPTIIASSFQPENIPSDEAEICDRKVCRSSSRASSVGPENVPSDETDVCERKVHRPSSRATSVKLEDVQDETEACERKIHKSGSRASSIQHEVVSADETESSKRKVHKSRSRASSIQHEDFLPDATETQERKVHRHSNRSSSVQHAGDSSGVTEICERKSHKPSSRSSSVQDGDVASDETVAKERKDCKSSSRAGSPSDEMKYDSINKVIVLQQEDIPADKTESGDRSSSKSSSRSGSVECKHVSSTDLELCDLTVCKPSSREGSIMCEDDPVDRIDEHEETVHKSSNRGGSVGQKVVFSETESAERRVCRSKCRASSAQKNHLEVIVEEEPCNTEGDKTGSSECRDIILSDDSVFNENRQPKASSVNSDASIVVVGEHSHSAGLTKKPGARSRHSSASSRCSSIQDDGTDVDVKMYSNKSHLPGSIQQNVFLDVLYERPEEKSGITTLQEAEIGNTAVPDVGNITGVSAEKCHTHSSEKVGDSFEGKIKKKCKRAESSSSCSFGAPTRTTSAVKRSDVEDPDAGTEGSSVTKSIRESKDVTDKSQKSSADGCVYDTGSVELNVPPMSTTHDADIPMETDDKKEKTQQAISMFGLNNQGISSPSVLPHEMFKFVSDGSGLPLRKARSESEYVVGAPTEGRRFTRSMLGISTSTTTTDVGLVTDGNASAKKARRSDIGEERTGHSLEALHSTPGDGSCSEMSSGSSIKWKRKAYSTNKGDSSSVQQVMEEYTTNRRLTRHQRSVLERSLELTLQPDPQLR